MRKNLVKVLVLILFAGFVSCDDDDPTPQGSGNAYVISRLEGTGDEAIVVHGLGLEAAGNYELSSVSVSSAGESYTLQKFSDYSFYYESEEEEYSTVLPAEGTYTFSYKFTSGETILSSDVLTDDFLIPANITASTYSNGVIDLVWDEVEDADLIYVQLRDADDDVVFNSITNSYLPGDETEYTITTSGGTWYASPTDGVSYTVEVRALLLDTSGSVQAVSIGSTPVIWGE